jgi:hypothetical protein
VRVSTADGVQGSDFCLRRCGRFASVDRRGRLRSHSIRVQYWEKSLHPRAIGDCGDAPTPPAPPRDSNLTAAELRLWRYRVNCGQKTVQVWELSGGFQIEYRGGVSRPRRKSRPQHRSQWGCIASRMRAGISPPAVNTGSVRRCGGKSPCLTGAPERFRAFLCLEQPVVKVPPAFGRRSIPAGCVAPPSNMLNILSRRAWPAGRLAALDAAPGLSPQAANPQ